MSYTVFFPTTQHEKRFENPTGIAVLVTTEMDERAITSRIEQFNKLEYERVGVLMRADLIAIKDAKNDEASFITLVKRFLIKKTKPLLKHCLT